MRYYTNLHKDTVAIHKMKKINSRRKGHGEERKLALHWRANGLFPDAKRHLEYQSQEAKEGVDLDNTACFDVQIKVGKQVPKFLYTIINQIRNQAGQYKVGVVRRDNEKPLVVMPLKDWEELAKKFLLF